MKQLLGFIEQRTTYYNFRPLYTCNKDNRGLTAELIVSPEYEYPNHGAVNLSYSNFYCVAKQFLDNLNVGTENKNTIFSLEFDEDSELEDNELRGGIHFKIDLRKLVDSGISLESRIKKASDIKVYRIVTTIETREQLYKLFANKGQIFIKETDCPCDDVMLYFEDKYIGPFPLNERHYDGGKYIIGEKVESYLLKYYGNTTANVSRIIFEKKEWSYTDNGEAFPAVIILDTAREELVDIITDDILLEDFVTALDETELADRCESSQLLSPLLHPDIRENRRNRIQDIFANIKKGEELKINIARTILESLKGDDKKALFEIIEGYVTENEKYQNIEKARDEAQSELDAAKEKISELSKKVSQYEEGQGEIGILSEKEIAEMTKRAEALKKDISDYEEKLGRYDELSYLYGAIQAKENEKAKLEKSNKELEEISKKLEQRINSISDKIDPFTTAFEPVVANAMLESAGKWQKEENDEYFRKRHANTNEFCKALSAAAERKKEHVLVDYIIKGVKQIRPTYSRNEIVNIYTCITQGFLTVFSGKPGTGKTSMCDIIAESLGLNHTGVKRFVPVSVERGWSSKRDLIGYYNPLTKKYDKSNKGIYEALMLLNQEREKSLLPYMVLLDEANLSPIEYYWSIFMKATEIDNATNTPIEIEIGTGEPVFIPETLKFIATVNNDQTTEPLSPRLIDRAWVIKLPSDNYDAVIAPPKTGVFTDVILWEDLKAAFSEDKRPAAPLKVLNDIYLLFNRFEMEVSPRIKNVILKYICVAQTLMENQTFDTGVTQKDEQAALDFAVMQKLLPKINGFYDYYQNFFDSLIRICDTNNLLRTKKEISKMIENKDNNMGHCQFLI